MPLGLRAKITISPDSVFESQWAHDMANAFCRARLRLERDAKSDRLHWD